MNNVASTGEIAHLLYVAAACRLWQRRFAALTRPPRRRRLARPSSRLH